MGWKITTRIKGALARLLGWGAGLGTAALALTNCATCPAGGCVKCALCLGALAGALALAARPLGEAVPSGDAGGSFRFPPRL